MTPASGGAFRAQGRAARTFVDHTTLLCTAGLGGQGCQSYYRDLWMRHRRPDGGDGGRGGSVILRTDSNVPTLLDIAYRKHLSAQPGKHGSSKRQRGADGHDIVVPVPLGTLVFDADTGENLADLAGAGEELIIARGGAGGVGNAHRRERTMGAPGEERKIRLELKLVADVGIVGLPNAGKSTLLGAISAARPRVAAFPFTTVVPTLGAVTLPAKTKGPRRQEEQVRCVAVDVPGLIEGASSGRGLGLEFLRHIERTRILWHVVDIASLEGRNPADDFRILNAELAQYNPAVAAKPQLLVANKMDVPGAKKALVQFKRSVKQPVIAITAQTGEGVPALLKATAKLLEKMS